MELIKSRPNGFSYNNVVNFLTTDTNYKDNTYRTCVEYECE